MKKKWKCTQVKVEFVKDLFGKLDAFDTLLNNNQALDTRVEVEKKQDIGNSMITIVLIALIMILVIVSGVL